MLSSRCGNMHAMWRLPNTETAASSRQKPTAPRTAPQEAVKRSRPAAVGLKNYPDAAGNNFRFF